MYVLPNLFRFAETANKEQKSLECRPLSIRSVCVLPINLAAFASDHWVISWVNPKTGIKATWPHGHMGTLRHKTRSAVATKRGAFQWAGGRGMSRCKRRDTRLRCFMLIAQVNGWNEATASPTPEWTAVVHCLCMYVYTYVHVAVCCATFRESGRNGNSNNGPQIFANVTVNWHNVARDAHAATRAFGLFTLTPFTPLMPICNTGTPPLWRLHFSCRFVQGFTRIFAPFVSQHQLLQIKSAINIWVSSRTFRNGPWPEQFACNIYDESLSISINQLLVAEAQRSTEIYAVGLQNLWAQLRLLRSWKPRPNPNPLGLCHDGYVTFIWPEINFSVLGPAESCFVINLLAECANNWVGCLFFGRAKKAKRRQNGRQFAEEVETVEVCPLSYGHGKNCGPLPHHMFHWYNWHFHYINVTIFHTFKPTLNASIYMHDSSLCYLLLLLISFRILQIAQKIHKILIPWNTWCVKGMMGLFKPGFGSLVWKCLGSHMLRLHTHT